MMEMIIKFLLVFILLVPNVGYSYDCPKKVYNLTGGQAAPCDGYFFRPDKELELRIKVQQFDTIKELSERQKDVIVTLEDRLKNQQEYNKELNKELKDQENASFWKTTLYFSLGVLVTGAIAANVGK